MTTELERLQQDLDRLQYNLISNSTDTIQRKELFRDLLHDLDDTHEKIEQAYQEWMAALDAVSSPIFLHDRDFRIMRCNLSYQHYAGLPFHQIIGRPYYEIFPRLAGPLHSCDKADKDCQDGDTDEEITVGNTIFSSHTRRVNNSQGKYLFSVLVLSDITLHKRAEILLRESEARYKRITDCITDYQYTVRIENGRAVETSQSDACEKVTGFTAQEFMENPDLWLQMVVPEDRIFVSQRVGQILSGEEVPPLEHRIVRKDGSLRWIQDTIILFKDAGGRLVSYGGVIRDITESKNAELALLRANRAYKVLSAVNHEVVYAVDEAQLLHSMCYIIVNTGGYSAAWVGYKRNDAPCGVQPISHCGLSDEEVTNLEDSCTVQTEDNGPVCKAIRSGTIQVIQDISSMPGSDARSGCTLMQHNKATIALPLTDGNEVFGCLAIYAKGLNPFSADELSLLEEMSSDLSFGISRLRLLNAHKFSEEKIHQSLLDTVQAIATLQEKRDPYTSGHQRRVADLAVAIATDMGLPEEKIRGLALAATIHDLGKIQIPAEILNKPGKLSASEFLIIKEHPMHGYEVLKDIDFPWPVAQIVLQHHEKLDGSGYPQELKGESILLEARILAVADIVESMTSHRPYRPGLGIKAALRQITRYRSVLYDAAVVDTCVKLFMEKNYKFSGMWHSIPI